MTDGRTWLEVDEIVVERGGIGVLDRLSMHVDAGERVSVIGPNGAGKTTLVRAISGLERVRAGEVTIDGKRVDGQPAHRVARAGVAHVPEGRRLFGRMTVRENLRLGAYGSRHGAVDEAEAEVLELFPRLGERRTQQAGSMSGGEQQMLAIGRALMRRPSLLLLDEPSIGLAPKIVEQIMLSIIDISRRLRVGILLVEQNAAVALDVCSRAYVLERGRIALQGTSSELAGDPRVRAAYLSA